MWLYPTALLAGLLLAFLASDLQNPDASGNQAQRSVNRSIAAIRLADASVQPFHRGSGRRQLSWESTLADV